MFCKVWRYWSMEVKVSISEFPPEFDQKSTLIILDQRIISLGFVGREAHEKSLYFGQSHDKK